MVKFTLPRRDQMKSDGWSLRFAQWLQENSAPWFMGEVVMREAYDLRHLRDLHTPTSELQELPNFAALREIIRYDQDGNYRPVRGFTGLKQGWYLSLANQSEVELALSWIYPLALAFWNEYENRTLKVTEFKETAARQSGMYRITQVMNEAQLQELVETVCQAQCLRCRLWWPSSPGGTESSRIPLLCPEPCHYLISRARATTG